MLKEVGPRLDEIVRTLRSDYGQLILKRMFEIANSKYVWFDHPMPRGSKGTHDEIQ